MTQTEIYTIAMNGNAITGTAEDVARWYCKQKGIKLYIITTCNVPYLWAQFPKADNRTYIACFEDFEDDIENGYKLFFSEFLSEENTDDDFVITRYRKS